MTFFGVRGSTPCSCESLKRYGGNTSCVVVESPGRDPVILDLGTGLRFYGLGDAAETPFRGTALVSHLHWDHVQGIPFFAPLLRDGSRLDFFAPKQEGVDLETAVRRFLAPPYFPVELDALPGDIVFHEVVEGALAVDGYDVRAATVPHVGPTVGYRVTVDGVSVVYISDHQQPGVGSSEVLPSVLELCRDADLVIHDAQFDDDEFALRSDWGHCTVDYAVEVAAQSGAKRLALFHHDPSHDDTRIDELLVRARALGRGSRSRRGHRGARGHDAFVRPGPRRIASASVRRTPGRSDGTSPRPAVRDGIT